MNPKFFSLIFEDTIRQMEKVLGAKAEEYASDLDRLQNFATASTLTNNNIAQACAGMMAKHTASVYEMVSTGKAYSAELWDEKIGDHLNYLVLLKACLIEAGLYTIDSDKEDTTP